MPIERKEKIVIFGMMGQLPFGGVAWQVLHHLEGFRRLGHDVFYVEDTGAWPYNPEQESVQEDCTYAIAFIDRMMSWCSLNGRWAYVSAAHNGHVFGVGDHQLDCVFREATILVNLTGSTRLHDRHLDIPVRIYLETDPVAPQIEIAKGVPRCIDHLKSHTHHFTYGENIGQPDCAVPALMFQFEPTRPPVIVDWWKTHKSAGKCYTTVANWKQTGKDIEWNGSTYAWSKHHEFLKLITLPPLTTDCLELALANVDDESRVLLDENQWKIVDSVAVSKDPFRYQDYIQSSRGEFTVAKDQNVRLRSGWFSDRSACYLASGRPVVTQNTGFGRTLPTGAGLFAFDDLEEAVSALQKIADAYDAHCQAASELADQYFSAERLLQSLLNRIRG